VIPGWLAACAGIVDKAIAPAAITAEANSARFLGVFLIM
jgi:hypothetical protein